MLNNSRSLNKVNKDFLFFSSQSCGRGGVGGELTLSSSGKMLGKVVSSLFVDL